MTIMAPSFLALCHLAASVARVVVCVFLFCALRSSVMGASAPVAPGVKNVVLNDGAAQRSTLTAIRVEFTTDVSQSLKKEHLLLRNITTGQLIDPIHYAPLAFDSGNLRATWRFPSLVANSLPDGNYIAALKSEALTAPAGERTWQSPGVGTPASVFSFHVQFGDSEGDRDVDFLDTANFRKAWKKNSTALEYVPSFDANLDGKVDESDEAAFAGGYFRVFPGVAAVYADLLNDTGLSLSDGLTYDAAIAGRVVEWRTGTKLQFFLGSNQEKLGPVRPRADGTFTITPQQIAGVLGKALVLGDYRLTLQVIRVDGTIDQIEVSFELYAKGNAPPRITSTPREVASASTVTREIELINNSTLGYYNSNLGHLLDGVLPWFPVRGDGTPGATFTSPPDISRVASKLGGWLNIPPNLTNGMWTDSPVTISPSWPLEEENAIVYEIDAANPIRNIVARFQADNGIHAWFDGTYIGGFHSLAEHEFGLGDISPGKHYLQVIREDEGIVDGYSVSVRGLEVLSLPFGANASPIGGSDIIASTPLQGVSPWSIDQINDGIAVTGDGSPFNGFVSDAMSGTITLDLVGNFDINGFVLSNDVNVLVEGVKDFRLDFYDSANVLISNSSILTAPLGQASPQTYSFDTVRNVSRVDLVVLNCYPDTLNRIEIREVSFLGPFPTVYSYAISATDADGDSITYSLVSGPAGVELNPNTGLLKWAVEPGIHEFRVRASDARGGFDDQSFTLNVVENDVPPSVSLQISSTVVDVGTEVVFQTAATDDLGIASITLKVNGLPVDLDANGQARVAGSAIGFLSAVATAVDSSGQSTSTSAQVRVRDPLESNPPDTGGVTTGGDPSDNTTDRPTVFFNSPEQESTTTYQTPIRATIRTQSHLQSWKLEYAPASTVDANDIGSSVTPWKILGQGTTPIENALVGTFDATLLRNDVYLVRLVAFNRNGRGQAEPLVLNVGGAAKLGNFKLEFLDLAIPVSGIPIQIKRIYNSFDASIKGDFGFGWTLGYGNADIRETRPDTGGLFTSMPFKDGTRVYLNLPDGTRAGFTFKPELAGGSFFGTLYKPKFKSDPGIRATLETPESDQAMLKLDPNGNAVLVFIPFGYNPDTYIVTTPDGVRYTYTQQEGLKEASDRNGNKLTFSADGITSSTGDAVKFLRDAQGRITRITDPVGNAINYTYNAAGNLTAHLDREATTATQFTYLANPAHYLQDVIDPRGNRAVRTEFDANGRVTAVIDALGNRQEQSFDPTQFTGTRTDSRGNVTALVYDQTGNLVEERKPEGGIARYEYTDAANPDKETKKTDPLGNITRYTYDARGNKLTETVAAGTPSALVTEFGYNEQNKVVGLILKNGTGTVLSSEAAEYDAAGNLTALTNAEGNTRRFTYDGQGRLITSTDFTGNLTSYDHVGGCACGRPGSITYADGAKKTFKHNALNLQSEEVDETGAITRFEYDGKGRQTSVIDHDGKATSFTYDENGNQTKRTDRLGRMTKYVYDAKNRLVKEIKILTDDGNDTNDVVINYEYDGDDHLTALIDPVGNRTEFAFDRDGRLNARKDPTGKVTAVNYDFAGNTKEVIDRRGLKRSFLYDGKNQPTAERWHDAGGNIIRTIAIAYDTLGRRSSIADPDSRYTYLYDVASRVTQVSNAGTPNVPTVILNYGYDKDGRTTSVTDDSGVSVKTSFDKRGRSDSFKWSGGGISPASVDLDRNGRGQVTGIKRFKDATLSSLVSRTTYDQIAPQGWVKQIQHRKANGQLYNAGTNFTYGYDAEGEVVSQSSQGNTTSYGYDPTGQLLAATHSDPAYPDETYAYDKAGNRTSSYLSNTYTTGAANRLLNDGKFNYGYDAEGNVTTKTEIATGKVTQFAYDHRGRLTSITEPAAGGGTNKQSFTYDALDRRIGINANDVVISIIYSEDNAWADYTPAGVPLARYLFADRIDGNLTKWTPVDGAQWYLTDKVDSIRGLTSATGAITETASYNSFGARVVSANVSNQRFGFSGRESILSTYQYHRSRVRESTTGQFLTEDRLGYGGGDVNLYRYVFNRPTFFTDPTGGSIGEYGALVSAIPNGPVGGILGEVSGILQGFGTTNLLYLGAFLAAANEVPDPVKPGGIYSGSRKVFRAAKDLFSILVGENPDIFKRGSTYCTLLNGFANDVPCSLASGFDKGIGIGSKIALARLTALGLLE